MTKFAPRLERRHQLAMQRTANDLRLLKSRTAGLDSGGTVITTTTALPVPFGFPTGILNTDASGYPTVTDSNGQTWDVSGTVLANSTVNTVTTTAFGSLTSFGIPANNSEAGSLYEVEAGGYGTQATGSAVNLTLQARFGASPGAASDVVGSAWTGLGGVTVGDAFQWSAKLRVQCVTNGVTATWRIFLLGIINDTVTSSGQSFAVGTGPTDVTQDSTSTIVMGISAHWASVAGSPTISKSGSQFGRRG